MPVITVEPTPKPDASPPTTTIPSVPNGEDSRIPGSVRGTEEYLLWWTKAGRLPPLATRASGSTPTLGQPGTRDLVRQHHRSRRAIRRPIRARHELQRVAHDRSRIRLLVSRQPDERALGRRDDAIRTAPSSADRSLTPPPDKRRLSRSLRRAFSVACCKSRGPIAHKGSK